MPGTKKHAPPLLSAERLAGQGPAHHDTLGRLGGGWVGEEALATVVYCALCAADFESAIVIAVNHAGDSDSTGAITGNLLGAANGMVANTRALDPAAGAGRSDAGHGWRAGQRSITGWDRRD